MSSRCFRAGFLAFSLCSAWACTPAPARDQHPHDHGGGAHTHDDHASASEHAAAAKTAPPSSSPAIELESIRTTVFTDKVLLYIEHPPLVRGARARFLAHISALATGQPVRTGQVSLVIDVGGTPVKLAAPAPARDGLFIPEGALEHAGSHRARVVVESEQAAETIDIGALVVHATVADARASAGGGEDLPNAVPFLLEQQWKIELLLAKAERKPLVERLDAPARIAIPHAAEAVVSSPAAGRLLAPESGELPFLGELVRAGQVLGFVEPPLATSDVAQMKALELQNQSIGIELELKAVEVARTAREAEGRLAFAERERARITNLRAEGLSTVQELEQVEQDVAVARNDVDASRAMRQSLDRLLSERARGNQAGGTLAVRLPLVAPITGRVVSEEHVVGESVQAADELFRVVDAGTVWVEGRVSEFDLARIPNQPGALLSLVALGERTIDITSAGGRLVHMGHVVDPATHTLSIRYELPNTDGLFKPGMLATLEVETKRAQEAVAIPAEAVIQDQGMPIAFVMLEGELFQKRELVLGIRDGGFVEVIKGLAADERVATRGAYFVKLAALSPASFGAGHAH